MSNDDITVGRLHTISTNHAKTYGKKNKGNTYYCTYTSTPDSYRTQKLQRECHPRCKRATGPTHVRPIIIVKPRGGKNVSKETITGDVQCHNISTRVYAGRFPTRCRHPPPPLDIQRRQTYSRSFLCECTNWLPKIHAFIPPSAHHIRHSKHKLRTAK